MPFTPSTAPAGVGTPVGPVAFQTNLIGTWTNQALPNSTNGEGSTDNPLSYNVMPLPQGDSYILKNFKLFETVEFNGDSAVAPPAVAPNRGAGTLQAPTAIFYEQNVEFAERPAEDQKSLRKGGVVHVENGAWLNRADSTPALSGPYPPPPGDGIKISDNANLIAKQMSVPHGNSILALGTVDDVVAGSPDIAVADTTPTPAGLDLSPYTTKLDNPDNYQNPDPDLTADPNIPIRTALGLIKPTHFLHWSVDTTGTGFTVNIPFEQRSAKVVKYAAAYWLLSQDGTNFPWLAYSQNIVLEISIQGTTYCFPHWTTNVVTRNS